MYKNEEFQQINTINKGELIMKFPGTRTRIPYESGTAFINNAGNIGYVALKITDLVTETVNESKRLTETQIKQAKSLQELKLEKQIKQMIKTSSITLFYSNTLNDFEVWTIPKTNNKIQIDNLQFHKMIIETYDIQKTIPSVEQVYELHKQIVADMKLSKDKASLEADLKILPQKVNEIYNIAFRLMRQRV